MSTPRSLPDRDKSTLMALHELRAIEQRRVAEEAAVAEARREAAARQEAERQVREEAERQAREEAERQAREEGDLVEAAERNAQITHLEGELEELARRMTELQEGARPVDEPLAAPPATRTAHRWAWGFAAVSWLGAITLIAILWQVAQRPPVEPRLVPPVIWADPPDAPSAQPRPKNDSPKNDSPKNDSPKNDSPAAGPTGLTPHRENAKGGGPHPPITVKRHDLPSRGEKPTLEACLRSEDPLACADVDTQPLGTGRRPKPKTR